MADLRRHLRIAVLGTRGVPEVMGGVETHCQELYPRLVERGHQVTLFARRGYVARAPYRWKGIDVVPLPTPRRKSLEAIAQTTLGVLAVARQRRKFDLLHLHAIGPALLVPLARALGIPVVMTHHGPDYDRQKWGPPAKAMLRLGERLAARHAHQIITVSKHIRGTLQEMFGREATYIPNGVNLPRLVPPGPLMERHGLTPGRYVLTVGRFVPEKGFHDLLRAFRAIETDWRLVIAGSADHEDDYSRSLRRMAGEDPRVCLTGFIRGDELGEMLSNAGLFVLPSYHEGLPIALLEALSYDLPILTSDIPANLELATKEEVFPVGDTGTLSAALALCMTAASQRVTGASVGRVREEFSWDRVTSYTERVYTALMTDSRAGMAASSR